MDFLIIGNGFDIAHNLPTRYTEFLVFCQEYDEKNPVSNVVELNKEFSTFIEHNVWLKYFLKLTETPFLKAIDKTWIDFEKEIREIIQNIENNHHRIEIEYTPEYLCVLTIDLEWRSVPNKLVTFVECVGEYDRESRTCVFRVKNVHNVESLVKYLYVQLRQFTRAFEIYCLHINTILVEKPIIFNERGTQIREAKQRLDLCSKQVSDAEKITLTT